MAEDLATMMPPFRVWDRGGDRPVLALHCSLAHSGAWTALAEGLTGVTVTALDQIGHGRAVDWDGVTDLHAAATNDAIAMAESLGRGTPVDLLGHSFGGTVAVRVALDRPDLVRSLTLVEPVIFAAAKASGDASFAPFEARHQVLADAIRSGKRREAAEDFHGYWGSGEPFAALSDRMQAYILDRIHLIPAQNPYLLDDATGLLRPGGLEGCAAPVLLIDGADSPPIIHAVHTELSRRLPRARCLSVAGAGHMVPITHANEVARAVQAHLDAA